MKRKRIYISGAITGRSELEVFVHFKLAEYSLNDNKLCRALNPMTLDHSHDKTWLSFMKHDIIALVHCDAIFMLRGWRKSKGARIEFNLANSLGVKILFE